MHRGPMPSRPRHPAQSTVTYIRLDCSEKSCQQLEWRIKGWILPQVITESSRDFPVETEVILRRDFEDESLNF